MYTRDYYYVIVENRQDGSFNINAVSNLSSISYIIYELEISEELSRLQKQFHKHLTCRPLRWHMQHLGLPTSTAYRIIGDHKIYRIAL